MTEEIFEFPSDQIKKVKNLDKGQFGRVYLATIDENYYAIKEVFGIANEQDLLAGFKREVSIFSKLNHENVVKFYGISSLSTQAIVMEYIEGGSLYKLLYDNDKKLILNKEQTTRVLSGILRGLDYLHQLKILHRDLKSKNVLIDVENNYKPKLCDFGVSKVMSQTVGVNTREIGTIIWMAPEVITSQDYSYKCDIYSFGIIVFECLTNSLPYAKMELVQILMAKAIERSPLLLPEGEYCPLFKYVFTECVQDNPKARPNTLDIIMRLESGGDFDQVDNDYRLAMEIQQSEYRSLDLLTQADEEYAKQIQQRYFYQSFKLLPENIKKQVLPSSPNLSLHSIPDSNVIDQNELSPIDTSLHVPTHQFTNFNSGRSKYNLPSSNESSTEDYSSNDFPYKHTHINFQPNDCPCGDDDDDDFIIFDPPDSMIINNESDDDQLCSEDEKDDITPIASRDNTRNDQKFLFSEYPLMQINSGTDNLNQHRNSLHFSMPDLNEPNEVIVFKTCKSIDSNNSNNNNNNNNNNSRNDSPLLSSEVYARPECKVIFDDKSHSIDNYNGLTTNTIETSLGSFMQIDYFIGHRANSAGPLERSTECIDDASKFSFPSNTMKQSGSMDRLTFEKATFSNKFRIGFRKLVSNVKKQPMPQATAFPFRQQSSTFTAAYKKKPPPFLSRVYSADLGGLDRLESNINDGIYIHTNNNNNNNNNNNTNNNNNNNNMETASDKRRAWLDDDVSTFDEPDFYSPNQHEN